MPLDIFDLRNPRIKVSQGKTLLEVFTGNCACCGKKFIVLQCNGVLQMSLEDAEKLAVDIKKMVIVAKTAP